MSGRIYAQLLVFGALCVGLPLPLAAATPTARSLASRTLLESFGRDDPAGVAKAARPLAEKGNAEARFVLGLCQLLGAGVAIDHVAATDWITKAATQGHTEAQLCLAWQYTSGLGVTQIDPETAAGWRNRAAGAEPGAAYARWFATEDGVPQPNFSGAFLWMIDAADEGNKEAISNLAQVHLFNFWTQADATQHLHWLQRAVELDDLAAVEQISLYYTIGAFVPADAAKGLELRHRAAEGGRAGSQLLLGQHYERGDGVAQDWKLALSWMDKSAKQNHLPAFHHLIDLLRNGRPGLPPDFPEAVRLAEKGRKLGDALCTRHLADLYNRGDGVPRNFKKSHELYREAADKGEVNAMTMLGWIHDKGEIGTPNYPEARLWYAKAADFGNLRAMRELGDMNDVGRGGPVDPSVAFEWYEKAARYGETYSQEKLGEMLLHGRGVMKDPEEAITWLMFAARNNNTQPLGPRLRTWKSIGSLDAAVTGLIAVARDYQDPWLEDNLLSVIQEDAALRLVLTKRVLQLTEDPSLLSLPGILPEACLSVLEANSAEPSIAAAAERWFLKLLAEDRVQSAFLLGWHALNGQSMSRDLARALRWAKISSSYSWKGSLLLALVECESSDNIARREASWATVRKFAEHGSVVANIAVAKHVVAGKGNQTDLALLVHQSAITVPALRRMGQSELADQVFGITRKEEEMQMGGKIDRLLLSRKPGSDAPPQMIYSLTPLYPPEALLANITGQVVIEFVIDQEGRTKDFRIVRSSDRCFEKAAIDAVKFWRFAPGWKKGRAVNVLASQLLEFEPH